MQYLQGRDQESQAIDPREDLLEVVSIFLGSLDESEVRRAARGDRPRAELCVKMDSGHFESRLKKY